MSKAQVSRAELSFHAHLPGPLFEEPGSTKVCLPTSAKFKALSTFLLVSVSCFWKGTLGRCPDLRPYPRVRRHSHAPATASASNLLQRYG